MRGRRFVRGRNAHESFDRQFQLFAAQRDEGRCILRRYTGLLRLLARVDLNETGRSLAYAIDLCPQGLCELRPVERVDDVEQLNSLAHLVALQRADQMKLDIREFRFESRPFRFGFLHAVLAIDAMTGLKHRTNVLGRMSLGNRDQLRLRGGRKRGLPCRIDARENGGQRVRGAVRCV